MRYAYWSALLAVLAVLLGVYASKAWRFAGPFTASGKPTSANGRVPSIFGEVHDERGPVPGARVRFQGTSQAVLTDAEGRFRLPRPSPYRLPIAAGGEGRVRGPGNSARVTAWKEGYFIAGAPADASPLAIRLTPLPREDHEQYTWIDPQPDPAQANHCGNCHAEIYREWSASAHARSLTGRHFRNLYEGSDWHGRQTIGWSLLAEHPDGAGVCTACHAPSMAFGDAAYYDLRKASGTAAHGVHCDYCHKVVDVAKESIGLTHGRFGLQLLRPAVGQLFFGPLDDVDRGEDAFAPVYRESRYCASCHEGTVFGVPVYSTYSEWLASPARREGKQCQSCHMAATGTLDNVAPGKGGIRRDPHTLANHRFFAGSQLDMLQRGVKVHVTLRSGLDDLQVDVEVRADGVGHRLPTGFADRNLLLVVEASDPHGQSMAPRSGPVLPQHAGKSMAGRPGRLYAKQLSDFDGRKPAPFWRAQPDPEDSRLVPGRADRTSYRFPAGGSHVQVRLLYRRFWEEVAILKNWPDNEIKLVDRTFPILLGNEVRWHGP
jgi:hypothetical protein